MPPRWTMLLILVATVGAWASLAALLSAELHQPEPTPSLLSPYALPAAVLCVLGLSSAVGLAVWVVAWSPELAGSLREPRVDAPPCPLCGSRGTL
jgi:hypothetical protein